jgi:phage-related protein
MQNPVLFVHFYQTDVGAEPVREWLLGLPPRDRKTIGTDIKTVQFGWPLGTPLIRKVEKDLWEVRIQLVGRIARVLFTFEDNIMLLLHGFIKKSQTTPKEDLDLARARIKESRGRK